MYIFLSTNPRHSTQNGPCGRTALQQVTTIYTHHIPVHRMWYVLISAKLMFMLHSCFSCIYNDKDTKVREFDIKKLCVALYVCRCLEWPKWDNQFFRYTTLKAPLHAKLFSFAARIHGAFLCVSGTQNWHIANDAYALCHCLFQSNNMGSAGRNILRERVLRIIAELFFA